MRWKPLVIAVVFGAATMSLVAQESTTTTKQESTTTTTKTMTGSVVQYTPGQTIVLSGPDGKTVTYTIGSAVQVPAEVQVGKRVTVSSEPASDGSGMAVVTRIETTSVDASGQTKQTTEKTEQSPSGTTKTTTSTSTYGTITAFQPGQSITIEQPGQKTVTYVIDTQSQLPQDVAVGKTVTITTRTVSGSEKPVVRSITYRKVTTTQPQ
jgi:hypothetical protein